MAKIESKEATSKKQAEAALRKEQAWIKQHSISFTFTKDEFLPNPDSNIFTKFPYGSYKQYAPLDSDEEND